jgi:short-subunit dehydrogenase
LDFGYRLEDTARDLTRNQINFILIAKRMRDQKLEELQAEAEKEAMFQAMKEG